MKGNRTVKPPRAPAPAPRPARTQGASVFSSFVRALEKLEGARGAAPRSREGSR